MCNVNFDNISSTQLALPAEMGSLGVSSASFRALSVFLASAFDTSDFLTVIFSETFEVVSFTKALEKFLSLPNEQDFPLDTTCLRQNCRVGGNRSKERHRKSELVLRSTYQIFDWDRNNSDRKFYNVVRYVHISLVP